MRQLRLILLAAFAVLVVAPPAGASVAHTVAPGETLWSIAAASNLTTRALAAANGLPADASVVLGSTIQIPSEAQAAAALGTSSSSTASSGSTAAAAPRTLGGYVVRPGDALSVIAARAGVSSAQLAYMNGLSASSRLVTGTVLKLPTGSAGAVRAAATTPAPAQRVVPAAAPAASPGHTSASQVRQIASAHGAPPALSSAVAYQESGFNNGVVSSANARGAMQILPGTWNWVQQNLTSQRLDPSSPSDNVHAGVLYLKQLMNDTGGDPRMAAAAYYQGLSSVRRIGMLPDTRRYVDNVMALRSRFGG